MNEDFLKNLSFQLLLFPIFLAKQKFTIIKIELCPETVKNGLIYKKKPRVKIS